MSYEQPEPDYTEPQDDPEGYQNYLRRKIVATARRYFVEHGHEELHSQHSYAPPRVTLEEVALAIKELDEWKREFKLTDID